MKRFCLLLLAFAMVFSLVACGSEPEHVESSAPPEEWSDRPAFTSLTEDEFLAAVEKSFISVHVKTIPEFKFFLDLQLNVLAVRAFDDEAHMVLGETYVARDLSFAECFEEIYLFAEELGILGSLNNEPVVVEMVYEMAGNGIKERKTAVMAPFDTDLFNLYYANQTYHTIEGTITPDGVLNYQ